MYVRWQPNGLLGLKIRLQRSERGPQARFDGAQRLSCAFRNFALRESFKVGEFHGHALSFWQDSQGSTDASRQLVLRHETFYVENGPELCCRSLFFHHSDAAAHPVDRAVASDYEQPATESSARGIEAPSKAPELIKRILDNFLDGAGVLQNVPGNGTQQSSITIVHIAERYFVTAHDASKQVLVRVPETSLGTSRLPSQALFRAGCLRSNAQLPSGDNPLTGRSQAPFHHLL